MRTMPAAATLLGALLCGCVSSNFNLATQRLDYTITSTAREVALGRKVARKVEKELPLLADEPVQRRVKEIGARLAAVCDRQELIYSFAVVDDEDVVVLHAADAVEADRVLARDG